MGVHQTKTFRSGSSVALRLPKGLAVDAGEKMLIEQQGELLTVRRASRRAEVARRLRALLPALEAIGRGASQP